MVHVMVSQCISGEQLLCSSFVFVHILYIIIYKTASRDGRFRHCVQLRCVEVQWTVTQMVLHLFLEGERLSDLAWEAIYNKALGILLLHELVFQLLNGSLLKDKFKKNFN